MKIKIILTILLIACCFWAAIHYAEKQQKDKHELYDLKEKYKNNYDSIYLSDLQIYYQGQPIKLRASFENWEKVLGRYTDSSSNTLNLSKLRNKPLLLDKIDSLYALMCIYFYDDTAFRIKLPKENISIEAYQKYSDYANRYPKSYIHSRQSYNGVRRSQNIKSFIICNKDTLSDIEAISMLFCNGQIMQLLFINRGKERYYPDNF